MMLRDRRLLIGAMLCAAVVALNLFPVCDPDVWWHLKTGELIWRARAIPRADPFSYTIGGTPWVSFEWLSQVIFWLAYSLGGPAALTWLKAAAAAGAFALFFRLGRGGLWAALALCAAAWSSGFFGERPLIFDALFLGLLLGSLDEKEKSPSLWIQGIALSALWANVHGGAALLGVAAVSAHSLARRSPRLLALAAACAAAMLANPHGVSVFTQLHQTMTFPQRELIGEWKPLTSLLNSHGLFYAAALAALTLAWKDDLALCLLTAALGGLGAWAVRYLPLFELCAAALAARAMERRRSPRLSVRALAAAAAAALACVYFGAPRRGVAACEYPEGAAAFLDREHVSGRMFNEYDQGGYLIWKGRPVFVDGRNAEYGPKFVEDAVRWSEPAVWAALDSKWRFDYAVVSNGRDYRAAVLDASPDWGLAFWDDVALVYVRRDGADGALLARTRYKYLRPNELSYGYIAALLKDRKTAAGTMAEIERAISESSANDNAHLMRACALGLLGRGREALPDLEAAVRHSPTKPGPLATIAWWYAANGDPDAARRAYEKALDLARDQNDALTEAYVRRSLSALDSARAQQTH